MGNSTLRLMILSFSSVLDTCLTWFTRKPSHA